MKQPQSLLPDDEMSLKDLWLLLYTGWRWILGSLIVSLVVAEIYLAVVPSQFEATVVFKVGQVGVAGLMSQQAGRVVGAGLAQQIESLEDAMDRLQGPDFQNAVVKSLGWKGDERERLFKYSFRVTSPAPRHVKIRIYGSSPVDARRAAEECWAMLAQTHQALADEVVATRGRAFTNLVADIAEAEAFLNHVEPLVNKNLLKDREQAAFRLQAVKDEKSRLRALRVRETLMQNSLKPELNAPTMVAEPVVVSTEPVYPKARRVWLFATVCGLLLGLMAVSLRSIARMTKENSARRTQRQEHPK